MTSEAIQFERELMTMLLAGDHPLLNTLREQYAMSTVNRREFTGVGFYTTFQVPENAPRLPDRKSFHFGDVAADFPTLQYGAGFVVHIRDGALELLEGYTYDEPWPDQVNDFTLRYEGGQRNLDSLLRNALSR